VAAELRVAADGVYRATAADLAAAGVDLAGTPAAAISLTSRGVPVPVRVAGGATFGSGSFLEFVGRAADSAFTRENVYRLVVGGPPGAAVAVDRRRAPRRGGVASAPVTLRLGTRRAYAFSSPTGDPWYDTRMTIGASAGEWTFEFDARGMAGSRGAAGLTVELFGGIDLPADPDHHVVLELNGAAVADARFDGLRAHRVAAALPPGLLRESGNRLVVRLPADLSTPFDVVHLQDYAITYVRALAADGDVAVLDAAGPRIDVAGFAHPRVVAYRADDGGVTLLARPRSRRGRPGEYVVQVPGAQRTATYLIAGETATGTPRIAAAPRTETLAAGPAQVVMIAHGELVAGLAPLVAARRAQGLTVDVVDVAAVYARYSFGVVDPEAIREYVAEAVRERGAEYVLLVGGDTYDYLGRLERPSRSLVPSLYLATSDVVRFAPADPAIADVDRDGVPDVAIGRLPVRTPRELAAVVAKTLAYERNDYGRSALLVADRADPRADETYASASEAMAARLGRGWDIRRLYLDEVVAASARPALLRAIGDGLALVSYVGHSGPQAWSRDAVLGVADVAALANAERPTVVVQWGCWNTYYVSPDQDGLGVALLLAERGGAAATLGATALSEESSQNELARRLAAELARPGTRIGAAVQAAKRALGRERPGLADVQYGWTLLGDPALVVGP